MKADEQSAQVRFITQFIVSCGATRLLCTWMDGAYRAEGIPAIDRCNHGDVRSVSPEKLSVAKSAGLGIDGRGRAATWGATKAEAFLRSLDTLISQITHLAQGANCTTEA